MKMDYKLLVQQFLQNHSLKDLELEHGVYASVSNNKRKISLSYDQIETKNDDELSWDCRGLILAKSDFNEFDVVDGKLNKDIMIGDTQIVAFPLRRFFNHGQEVANIDLQDKHLSVLEKVDGTFTILYFDQFMHEWHVATRSVPEANLFIDTSKFTFRTLFEEALKESNYSFKELTSKLDATITYCFELTSPYNRIVVKYDDIELTLLAARSLTTLKEIDISNLDIGVQHVYTHNLSSLQFLLA